MNHFMTEVLHAENKVMDTWVLKAEELTEKEKKPMKELPDVALLPGCHMTSALGGKGAHLNVNSFMYR